MRMQHLSNFRKECQKNAVYVEIYTLRWKNYYETILFCMLQLVNMKAHLAEICGGSHSAIKDSIASGYFTSNTDKNGSYQFSWNLDVIMLSSGQLILLSEVIMTQSPSGIGKLQIHNQGSAVVCIIKPDCSDFMLQVLKIIKGMVCLS